MKDLKNLKNNNRTDKARSAWRAICAAAFSAALAVNAFADDETANYWSESDIAKGSSNLVSDIGKWGLGIGFSIIGVAIIAFFVRKALEDKVEGQAWTKRILGAFVCGVGIFLIGSIFSIVGHYMGVEIG